MDDITFSLQTCCHTNQQARSGDAACLLTSGLEVRCVRRPISPGASPSSVDAVASQRFLRLTRADISLATCCDRH